MSQKKNSTMQNNVLHFRKVLGLHIIAQKFRITFYFMKDITEYILDIFSLIMHMINNKEILYSVLWYFSTDAVF